MRSSGALGRTYQEFVEDETCASKSNSSNCPGKLSIVGIGPGFIDDISERAAYTLENAEVIVGYEPYLELVEEFLAGKIIIGTGMMQEVERCQAAIDMAMQGKNVAVVSSGDPGIYGMAGLVLELVMKIPPESRPQVKVVPGISAVGAAASLLGAPLMHDFAVISLSDLLTPWDVIKKRVEMAAAADFVIALYNPKSTRRVNHIVEVQKIVLQHRSGETPVGIVRNALRDEQSVKISNLQEFTNEFIDMFSLVIIGNSQTFARDGWMVTPRGYSV